MVKADSYAGDEAGEKFEQAGDTFVVPVEIAAQVEKVVYRKHNSELTFEDKDSQVLLTSPNFHHGNWSQVSAFSVADLKFHWDD